MNSFGRWGRGLANKFLGGLNAGQEAAEAEAARSEHTLGQGLGLGSSAKDEHPLLPRLQRPGPGDNPHYHAVVWALRECFTLLERAAKVEADAPLPPGESGQLRVSTKAEVAMGKGGGSDGSGGPGFGGRFHGLGATVINLGARSSRGNSSETTNTSGVSTSSGTLLRRDSCAAALGRAVARLAYAVKTPGRRAQRRWGTYLLPAFRSLAEPVQAMGDSEACRARQEALVILNLLLCAKQSKLRRLLPSELWP